MNNKRPLLFAILGKTNSGMTTTTHSLLADFEQDGRVLSWPTYVTRAGRGDDRPGDVIPVSVAEFEDLWERKMLYERDPTQNGDLYGKEQARLDWAMEQAGVLIFHINYVGFEKIAADFPENVRGIWLDISQETSAERYRRRCELNGDPFVQHKLDERLAKGEVEDCWLGSTPLLVDQGKLRREHLKALNGEPPKERVYMGALTYFLTLLAEFGHIDVLQRFGDRTLRQTGDESTD